MTIKYLDSKRISGLSTDIAETVTFSDDFSGADNWVDQGANFGVNITTDVLDFSVTRRDINNGTTYDLTSTSNSNWVLRTKVNFTTVSNSSASGYFLFIGLSSASSSTDINNGGVTQDFIGLQAIINNTAPKMGIGVYDSSGGILNPMTTSFTTLMTVGTIYLEIIRVSTTSLKINIYSNSSYTTLIETISETIPATISNLRYIRVSNGVVNSGGSGANTVTGTVDDIQFWNGVSLHNKPDSTTVQTNSLFTETDTGKLKWSSNNWGESGGWVELGRTTLGSANADITVSSLANKRYYMYILDQTAGQSGSCDPFIRFNSDINPNYSSRVTDVGSYHATTVTQNQARIGGHPAGTRGNFLIGYLANYATKEKLSQSWEVGVDVLGAGNAPYRAEGVAKWADTTSAINSITITTNSAQTWTAGTQLVVLGYDPADIHATNFWEELYSGNSGGSVASLAYSVNISAKKYIMFSYHAKNSTSAANMGMQFNGDTGNTYNFRYNINGGTDATTNQAQIQTTISTTDLGHFVVGFIINNAANEKLIMIPQIIQRNTAGGGTAPTRWEVYGKWANTAAQITSIQFVCTSGNLTVNDFKVWGSN